MSLEFRIYDINIEKPKKLRILFHSNTTEEEDSLYLFFQNVEEVSNL